MRVLQDENLIELLCLVKDAVELVDHVDPDLPDSPFSKAKDAASELHQFICQAKSNHSAVSLQNQSEMVKLIGKTVAQVQVTSTAVRQVTEFVEHYVTEQSTRGAVVTGLQAHIKTLEVQKQASQNRLGMFYNIFAFFNPYSVERKTVAIRDLLAALEDRSNIKLTQVFQERGLQLGDGRTKNILFQDNNLKSRIQQRMIFSR